MALDVDNVRVAITGAFYTGATGSTAPTDSTTAPDGAFDDVGWISEDGITESYDEDNTVIKAWQGGATVRSLTTSTTATLQLTCIETNIVSLELYHRGSVVDDGKIEVKAPVTDKRAFILDVLDGEDHLRLYVANGEVTERGDITYKGDETVSYPLTITCYPDEDGVLLIKFSDSAAWETAS